MGPLEPCSKEICLDEVAVFTDVVCSPPTISSISRLPHPLPELAPLILPIHFSFNHSANKLIIVISVAVLHGMVQAFISTLIFIPPP